MYVAVIVEVPFRWIHLLTAEPHQECRVEIVEDIRLKGKEENSRNRETESKRTKKLAYVF
jgi:hypothetical protein